MAMGLSSMLVSVALIGAYLRPGSCFAMKSRGQLGVGTACSSDTDCPASGLSRCCPLSPGFADACPHDLVSGPTQACNTTYGLAECTCASTPSCTEGQDMWPYAAEKKGMKQWLVVGDSISIGMDFSMNAKGDITDNGIQAVHSAGNALNTQRGLSCIADWLEQADRWDLISFNFGLHDLAMSHERIEPTEYAENLADIAQLISTKAPQAKLIFATTTPVPLGIDGECVLHESPSEGGCPPRSQEDVAIYNKAALKALNALPIDIHVVDLYYQVTSKCGERYEDCDAYHTRHKNVHFEAEGFRKLGNTLLHAVANLLQ